MSLEQRRGYELALPVENKAEEKVPEEARSLARVRNYRNSLKMRAVDADFDFETVVKEGREVDECQRAPRQIVEVPERLRLARPGREVAKGFVVNCRDCFRNYCYGRGC